MYLNHSSRNLADWCLTSVLLLVCVYYEKVKYIINLRFMYRNHMSLSLLLNSSRLLILLLKWLMQDFCSQCQQKDKRWLTVYHLCRSTSSQECLIATCNTIWLWSCTPSHTTLAVLLTAEPELLWWSKACYDAILSKF